MMVRAAEAIEQANSLVRKHGTRNADRLASEVGIIVVPRNFVKQKGVYKVIERNRYVFIKSDLHPVMRSIVLLHEIGHDMLHREESVVAGGFKEFNIFDMQDRRMEYEANVFAAQISLPDEEMLDYIYKGYDVGQIAKAMKSDINLVALKADALIALGYNLRAQEFRKNFLKYSETVNL